MELKPTKPLSGFIELMPAQQRCFDECAKRMRAALAGAGFTHIDLPSIERAEVLTDEDNWDEIETQMFLFQKGDTKMGLRYDGTVGLARYTAGNANGLVFPFRAYQFAKNYRGERPQRGRYREFYQMDLDILGINELSIDYDAEIVAVLSSAYDSIREFVGPTFARVGSRKFWDALFDYLKLPRDSARQAFVLIDKKDKLKDGFEPALKEAVGDKAAKAILSVFSAGYQTLAGKTEALNAAIGELDGFIAKIRAMGVKNADIDLSIMRGHAYYTSIVFEFFLEKFPDLGSVGGGGRYEDLTGKFSRTKIVGVGAAVGFSRMMAALLDEDKINLAPFETPIDAAVLVLGQENVLYAMNALAELRRAGIVAAPFLDADKKLKNQMEYANKIRARFSVIIGEDEAAKKILTLKDMAGGTQTAETTLGAIKKIKPEA